jgi:hypothetical protein
MISQVIKSNHKQAKERVGLISIKSLWTCKKSSNFEIPNSFHELIYHPSAVKSFLFKVLQFLKIPIKFY